MRSRFREINERIPMVSFRCNNKFDDKHILITTQQFSYIRLWEKYIKCILKRNIYFYKQQYVKLCFRCEKIISIRVNEHRIWFVFAWTHFKEFIFSSLSKFWRKTLITINISSGLIMTLSVWTNAVIHLNKTPMTRNYVPFLWLNF